MRRSIGFLLGGLVYLTCLVPSTGEAVSLTSWNVTELNGTGDRVEVTIGSSGGTLTLAVQWIAGAGNLLTPVGIDFFAYNGTASFNSVSGSSGAWSDQGSKNMAGFGSFTHRLHGPGDDGGIAPALLFTLSGSSVFPFNASGAQFAAHVRYGNGCSGFVSTAGASSSLVGSDSSCGAVRVPEPSSLLLLAVALAFGACLLRSRRLSHLG
jgi:hypothetical protein